MAIGANSYGTVAGVAAFCRIYTNAGSFDGTTIPTLTQVEGFIDQTSALLNSSLAGQGFAIPIVQADAKLACDGIVNQLVSDLSHAANTAGRFFSERSLAGGLSVWAQVRKEIDEWVSDSATGLSALGASRRVESALTIGFRDGDDNGDAVEPIFARDQYGSDRP
jgi:hypothetical protein